MREREIVRERERERDSERKREREGGKVFQVNFTNLSVCISHLNEVIQVKYKM